MKKFLIFLILLAFAIPCQAADVAFTDSIAVSRTWLNGFAWTGHVPKDRAFRWAKEVENKLDGDSSVDSMFFGGRTSDPTLTEGRIYYDTTSNVFKYHNGTSFQTFAAESGTVSLDVAYGNGNTIDVDGSAVTLDNDTTDNNVLLILTQDDTTGNTDAMTIVNTNTGDAIQISPDATTGGGINIIAKAAGTTPLIILDGSTNNINLNDDKGQLLIQADNPYNDAGAAGLVIIDSGTPITSAEGFLARFVHSGSARTNAFAVEIEVPATQPALFMDGGLTITGQASANHNTVAITNNDGSNNKTALTVNNEGTSAAVIITCDDTDTPAMDVVGLASSTVTLVNFDGDTGDWIGGADDVAMVEINIGSTANADAGGGAFAVHAAFQPAASSEGFLARFVSTGTATATATAVEIEVPATQPAFATNGIVKLNGQTAAGGAILQVAAIGLSGNADAMTITNDGTGDCLQITPTDTDTGGINMVGKAAGTVPLIILDSTTNNMNLADNKGQLLIQSDVAYNSTGAAGLMIFHQTGQPVSAAEGFLARFVSTGSAQTNAHAVEIEVPATQPALKTNGIVNISGQDAAGAAILQVDGIGASGNADAMTLSNTGTGDNLQITCGTTTAGSAIHILAKEQQTTTLIKVDSSGTDPNWIGADDVGMITLIQDTALGNTGASLISLQNTAQQDSGAEGFLLRLIDTGTARTDAHAMEIETTNTTPALKLNNELTITGADSAGTLLSITGADVAGDTDTIVVTHRGDASALKITTSEPAGTGIEVVCDAAQTSSAVLVDGTTGAFVGASDTGMLHLKSDGALASVNASLLFINNTGVPVDDSRGSSLRIIDTGNASAGTAGYAVYIKATDDTVEALFVDDGKVQIDEILTTGIGYQSTVITKVANSDGGSGSTIDPGTRVVHVTGFTANANDWILLPSGVIGQRLTIISDVAHEIRTPAASDDTINDVDADGGANEYAVVLDDINDFICTGTGASWIAVAHDKLGAAKTIAPDGV